MKSCSIPICIGQACEHYEERCDVNDGSGHCGLMRGLMNYEGGPLKAWMETYEGWVCVHKLLLRIEAQERCLAAARKEIERLRSERDAARREICDGYHDTHGHAEQRGWVGLYPEPVAKSKTDGSERCRLWPPNCSNVKARRFHNGKCGNWCQEYEPEAKP